MEKTQLMLVDDEPSILKALARNLDDQNMDITMATDGATALTLLDKNPVDIVITDQRMPGMTGVQFLSVAQQKHPELISIILTGYADIQVAIAAINDIGVYKFIVKPWNDYDLIMTVEKAKRLSAMMKSKKLFTEDLLVPSDRMIMAEGMDRSKPVANSAEKIDSTFKDSPKTFFELISEVKTLPYSREELESIINRQSKSTIKKIRAHVVDSLYCKRSCQLLGANYSSPTQKDMKVLHAYALYELQLLPDFARRFYD